MGVYSSTTHQAEYIVARLGRENVTIISVEPTGSACLFASLQVGEPVPVSP